MEITLAQDKALNALLYFAERIKPLYLTKAIKLLYLADEMAIKQSGVPVTWLNYKAWKLGPVPEDIYQQVKYAHHQYLKGNGGHTIQQLEVSTPPENFRDGILLTPAKDFDDAQFSDYDIEVLDAIIKAYGKLSSEQLIELLHSKGTLWHKLVEANNLDKQFELKNNRSDFIIELTELLDTDYKRSAFEVAYQSYLLQNELL
ncbi:MAG: SocA family protein [Sphingobacteriaceae bacterium]|nr:SocA family protein [Sphingobacteriaceae bacterium]